MSAPGARASSGIDTLDSEGLPSWLKAAAGTSISNIKSGPCGNTPLHGTALSVVRGAHWAEGRLKYVDHWRQRVMIRNRRSMNLGISQSSYP